MAVQSRTVPLFSPAISPTCPAVPPGDRVPSTIRSSTRALSVRVRKRPTLEPLSEKERPVMVWPSPRKVPWKMGMGEKSVPLRSRSAVSSTVTPTDQVSLVQLRANSWKSERVAMLTVPAAPAGGSREKRRAAASSRAGIRLVRFMAGPPLGRLRSGSPDSCSR